ncbi:epimerase family protein SDR39U1 homolog, chloroplastic isoform X2 [Amborella trichopoda]|uniref:epimerase family protein SDR39U1 homolog, chloroplastic isoform X2 n=1 Tax=Amborella trichopoda TaxID=13333 RepID=UPI0009BE4A73|nr:epimerase family protein SDR39U1 homolog, chloroplastic isoform X2 [Amborella trichopoda]|eukprot:XP_020529485.1 epimerase family protein SDR39U1 homolog, chloroplastic isoform X2 [Amborella trichopoda]
MLWLTELAQQTDTSPASKPDMELCKISPHWTKTSPSLFHLRRPRLIKEEKRCRIFCVDNNQSLKSEQLIVSITGATGFIGRRLVQRLLADNHVVRVLTRSRSKTKSIFPAKEFPGIIIVEEPEWPKCIEASSAVVNLAGLPISTRWSAEIKKEIKRSRVNTTTKVVDVINCLSPDVQPKVLVSATAVGYYGTSETQVFDEQSPSGNDFLAEVCREWEARAQGVNKDVRLVLIRIGVVLGKDGGALARMIPLFMMFAGGPLGSGKQWQMIAAGFPGFIWMTWLALLWKLYQINHIKESSMALLQIQCGWVKCVSSWVESWAGHRGCQSQILLSRQSLVKGLLLFWMDKKFFRRKPKSWVSRLTTHMSVMPLRTS